MTPDETRRRLALLEATLREIMRIFDESVDDDRCAPPAEALDGDLLLQWLSIQGKARRLLEEDP